MFRNRAFQVKIVKEPKPSSDSPEESNIFESVEVAAAYAEIIKNVVTHTALVIGGVFIVCKIVERVCR